MLLWRNFSGLPGKAALATVIFLFLISDPVKADKVTVLNAEKFGAVGNGTTDDGPAVLRLLDAANALTNHVEIHFPALKTFYLATGRDGYAFRLEHRRDFVLDGGHSTFLIAPQLRFLRLTNCWNVAVRNCKVDYSPLPFSEGVLIGKNKVEHWFDVRVDEGTVPLAGGPTHARDEQTFFCALWHPGPYSTLKDPYLTREMCTIAKLDHPKDADEHVVRVTTSRAESQLFDEMETSQWRVSLPIEGIAHRVGAGASCDVQHNEDVLFENIEMWSAPWFAFTVMDNEGAMRFGNVNIRPKPGSHRSLSSWRDGFHVKNNRSRIFWENCIVQGTGDDAFNIACHPSTVQEMYSPTRLRLSQNFPLGLAGMRPDDFLAAFDVANGALLSRARIISVVVTNVPAASTNEPPSAPVVVIDLNEPIAGMEAGKTLVWDENSANPHSLLRHCRVDTSCRFRSPVSVEESQINALMWFTGDELEAPIPRDIVVKDSVLRQGQGNPNLVVMVDYPNLSGQRPVAPVIYNVLFQNNKISGGFIVRDASNVTVSSNEFIDPRRMLEFKNVEQVELSDDLRGGKLITDLQEITTTPKDAPQIKVTVKK